MSSIVSRFGDDTHLKSYYHSSARFYKPNSIQKVSITHHKDLGSPVMGFFALVVPCSCVVIGTIICGRIVIKLLAQNWFPYAVAGVLHLQPYSNEAS